MQLTIGLAFLGGLASFLSPCVLPLVPAYIGYLGGRAMGKDERQASYSRWMTFSHGVAFVFGFSLIFILLGLSISAISVLLADIRPWLVRIGAVIIVVFGLHMIGIIRIGFLQYDLRPLSTLDITRGLLSSFMMGIFFSAGWSPCIGPVLSLINEFVLESGSISQGFLLLAAYSSGLAIPFLIAAIAIERVSRMLIRFRKSTHFVEIGTGFILIILGLMLLFGVFQQLANLGPLIDFGL